MPLSDDCENGDRAKSLSFQMWSGGCHAARDARMNKAWTCRETVMYENSFSSCVITKGNHATKDNLFRSSQKAVSNDSLFIRFSARQQYELL